MGDLLETLRSVRQYRDFPNDWRDQAMSDAAGEIERLREEVEVLNDYCHHYRYLAEIRLAAVGRTRLLTDEDVEAVADAVAAKFESSLPRGQ